VQLARIQHLRIGDKAFARDLAFYDDWRAPLASLGVSLANVGGDELPSLHARMLAGHAERAAAGEG
jgi:hypothetical protein